jgi:hypothetical protein
LGSTIGNNPSGIRMTNTDTGNYASISAGLVGQDNAGMDFSVDGTRRMVIDGSGNLGIGTVSPTEKLTVSGAISATSNAANFDQNKATFDYNSGAGRIASYVSTGSNLQFFTNASGGTVNERVRIDSSGNLLVGTTSASIGNTSGSRFVDEGRTLNITNTTATNPSIITNQVGFGGTTVSFRYTNSEKGYIETSSVAVAYVTTSDYRLKNTIAPMTGALAKVALLKPVTYKWNSDGSDGQGFIAHELAEVCPQAVAGEKDAVDAEGNPKYQGIDTSFLVATLTAAIQEQQAIIESLKARLDAANL